MKKIYVLIAFVLVLGLIFAFRHALLPPIGGAPEGERLAEIQAQTNYRDGSLQNDLALDESLSAVIGAIFGVVGVWMQLVSDNQMRTYRSTKHAKVIIYIY